MPLNISSIGSYPRPAPTTERISGPLAPSTEGVAGAEKPFCNLVTKALDDLQSAQSDVDAKTIDFVSGGETELHNLMIASEKVNLGFNLTLQLRNKALEAYQEIMRTQV
jgi:flagellar hook-basal body complex protein FliE